MPADATVHSLLVPLLDSFVSLRSPSPLLLAVCKGPYTPPVPFLLVMLLPPFYSVSRREIKQASFLSQQLLAGVCICRSTYAF